MQCSTYRDNGQQRCPASAQKHLSLRCTAADHWTPYPAKVACDVSSEASETDKPTHSSATLCSAQRVLSVGYTSVYRALLEAMCAYSLRQGRLLHLGFLRLALLGEPVAELPFSRSFFLLHLVLKSSMLRHCEA